MSLENIIRKVSEMAGNTSPMGASIKFNFGKKAWRCQLSYRQGDYL